MYLRNMWNINVLLLTVCSYLLQLSCLAGECWRAVVRSLQSNQAAGWEGSNWCSQWRGKVFTQRRQVNSTADWLSCTRKWQENFFQLSAVVMPEYFALFILDLFSEILNIYKCLLIRRTLSSFVINCQSMMKKVLKCCCRLCVYLILTFMSCTSIRSKFSTLTQFHRSRRRFWMLSTEIRYIPSDQREMN